MIELQRDMVEHKIATELSEANGEIAQYRALVAQDRKVVEPHRQAERAEQQMAEGTLSPLNTYRNMSAYNSAKKLEEVHQIQLVRATYKVKNIWDYEVTSLYHYFEYAPLTDGVPEQRGIR